MTVPAPYDAALDGRAERLSRVPLAHRFRHNPRGAILAGRHAELDAYDLCHWAVDSYRCWKLSVEHSRSTLEQQHDQGGAS